MSLTVKNVYKNGDGRWRAYCVDENNNPHVVSYPRILMEEKLGRPLEPNEDVHHKDGNFDNNDIDNLEVILSGLHRHNHSQKYIDTIETCQICGQKYTMTAKKWTTFFGNLSRKHRITQNWLTCSKSCAGKAGSGLYDPLYSVDDRLEELKNEWLK